MLFVETADFVAKRVLHARRPSTTPLHTIDGVQVDQLHNLVAFLAALHARERDQLPLRRKLGRARRRSGSGRPRVLWIYDPRGAAAIGRFGEDLVVYDCVDDYGQQVGESRRAQRLVSRLDLEVGARADLVFTTTARLRSRHDRPRGGVHLVPNVGDFEHFRPAADRSTADPELLALRARSSASPGI